MVGLGRFELPTRSLGNCCSIHLSYSPAVIKVADAAGAQRSAAMGLKSSRDPVLSKDIVNQWTTEAAPPEGGASAIIGFCGPGVLSFVASGETDRQHGKAATTKAVRLFARRSDPESGNEKSGS